MIVECVWCYITETLEDDMVGFRGMFFHSPTCLEEYRDWKAREQEEAGADDMDSFDGPVAETDLW